jgi:alpha-tubulin suppressor-like RCC1 family protein
MKDGGEAFMTTNTEQRRGLAFGLVLLLGLWFAPAVWAEDTPPPGVRPETISAGQNHTCGVRGDGTVTCWGANEYGTLPASATFAN